VSKLKAIGVIGIPYNVGWKGEGIDEGPSALRAAGLLKELEQVAEAVVDLGDASVDLPPRDDSNPKLLNPHQVIAVCKAIAPRVRSACEQGYLPLVLGAEDSAIMGIVEGLAQGLSVPIGLIYLDAHGDFNTPETTPSGLVGGMDVAVLAGRGPDLLTKIFGHKPQLREEQIAIFGARDLDPPEKEMLRRSNIHLYTMDRVRELGAERAIMEAAEKLSRFCDKIYVHVDIDVLEPTEMKAIHMSVPNGMTLAECARVLRNVRKIGKLCGLAVMVFNARKDQKGTEARKLNQLIVDGLRYD
jgi:arginase